MKELQDIKGTYYYFREKAKKDSLDYGLIFAFRANSMEEAYDELIRDYYREYREVVTKEDIIDKNLYEFMYTKEI